MDPAGFQTLIDQHRSLSQGQRSILDYVRYATTLRQKAFSHRFLAHYPEFFFVEAFHAGLSKDLQSRMPEINEGTTLAAYTLTAIRIGRPLERPGWKPPAPSGGGSRWPRRSGASATVAALSPPPEAATDEAKLAAWERSNLNGQDRRDARIKRGACTFWKLLPAISPRTQEDGDGDVHMGEDGEVHMGEDGEYCWNSISKTRC